jgi:hypothetical protein
MRCSCCGRWRVRAVVLSRDPRATLPLLRVTHCGYLVGEYNTPEEVAGVLADAGVDLASLVEEVTETPTGTGAAARAARARPSGAARSG